MKKHRVILTLTIVAKLTILDVCKAPTYVSGLIISPERKYIPHIVTQLFTKDLTTMPKKLKTNFSVLWETRTNVIKTPINKCRLSLLIISRKGYFFHIILQCPKACIQSLWKKFVTWKRTLKSFSSRSWFKYRKCFGLSNIPFSRPAA